MPIAKYPSELSKITKTVQHSSGVFDIDCSSATDFYLNFDNEFFDLGAAVTTLTPVYVGGKTVTNVAEGTAFSTSLTNLTGGIESFPSTGDVVIVAYALSSPNARTLQVTSSGYGKILDARVDDTEDINIAIFAKTIGSTPDTSISFLSNGANTEGSAIAIHVWRNINKEEILSQPVKFTSSINTGFPTPPPINAVDKEVVLIIGASAHDNGLDTFATPSGFSNFITAGANDTEDVSIGMGSLIASGSLTVTPPTFSYSTTYSNNTAYSAIGVTMTLKPAISGSAALSSSIISFSNPTSDIKDISVLLKKPSSSVIPTTIAWPSNIVKISSSPATTIFPGQTLSYKFYSFNNQIYFSNVDSQAIGTPPGTYGPIYQRSMSTEDSATAIAIEPGFYSLSTSLSNAYLETENNGQVDLGSYGQPLVQYLDEESSISLQIRAGGVSSEGALFTNLDGSLANTVNTRKMLYVSSSNIWIYNNGSETYSIADSALSTLTAEFPATGTALSAAALNIFATDNSNIVAAEFNEASELYVANLSSGPVALTLVTSPVGGVYSVAYDLKNDIFVVGGQNGIAISNNKGISWTIVDDTRAFSIIYSEGIGLIALDDPGSATSRISTNGYLWTQYSISPASLAIANSSDASGVIAANSAGIVFYTGGSFRYSTDGYNFSLIPALESEIAALAATGTIFDPKVFSSGDRVFVVINVRPAGAAVFNLYYSTDLINWQKMDTGITDPLEPDANSLIGWGISENKILVRSYDNRSAELGGTSDGAFSAVSLILEPSSGSGLVSIFKFKEI